MIAMLNVHPSRVNDLLEPDELQTEPRLAVDSYIDSFGNRCSRSSRRRALRLSSFHSHQRLWQPDPFNLVCPGVTVGSLPHEVLYFLLSSRYCEVDRFSNIAVELFGDVAPAGAACKPSATGPQPRGVQLSAGQADKTALDVYTERVGVCRDFQHLAITFCRALNIPARYATGYLGDIGVPCAYHGLQRMVRGLP